MSLKDQMMLIFLFSKDFSIRDAEKLLPHLSHTAVVHFYQKLRKVLFEKMESIKMEGTTNAQANVIEIDESYFGRKRKYNRGRLTNKQWVFGIVERNTRKTYFVPVDDRKKTTLLPIMIDKIAKGAMIHHDDFSVYRNIENDGYLHDVVCHTEQFVSDTGAHTNAVEGNSYYLLNLL